MFDNKQREFDNKLYLGKFLNSILVINDLISGNMEYSQSFLREVDPRKIKDFEA